MQLAQIAHVHLGGEGGEARLHVVGAAAEQFEHLVHRAVEQHVVIGHVEMAVVVDPGRLDPHHRGDERREEHRFEIEAVEHAGIVPDIRDVAANYSGAGRTSSAIVPFRTRRPAGGSRLALQHCREAWPGFGDRPSSGSTPASQQEAAMGRFTSLLYGLAAYAVFFGTFLYAIGFVDRLVVPKTIDTGAAGPVAGSADRQPAADVAVRRPAQRHGAQAVQAMVDAIRAALRSSAAPMCCSRASRSSCCSGSGGRCRRWSGRSPIRQLATRVDRRCRSSAGCWCSLSTFLINHFELFGLHQVVNNLAGRRMPAPRFKTPVLYKFVRHPIYLGFIIAFWAAPTMTVGHLLFAAVTTAYIFVGILLEERDLVELFGDEYRRYRKRVSMLLPWRKSA